MSIAIVQRKDVSIKNTSVEVNVPNNPTAKLMYYLCCVNRTLDLVGLNISGINYAFVSLINDYQNYHLVTQMEKQKILAVATELQPTVLENKVFFVTETAGDYSNAFYEINSTEVNVAATDEVIIGGVRKRVNKIMIYERRWMQDHYYDPIRALETELRTVSYNGYFFLFALVFYLKKSFATWFN